ncbi:hypothetical protein ACJ72_02967, partial [Emergomyces africanus]
MSYLRFFYELATWPRPHNQKFDGSTVRRTETWELSRRDGFGLSRDVAGNVQAVWTPLNQRRAGGGKVIPVRIRGGWTGHIIEDDANTTRGYGGNGGNAEHAVVENCMCTACERRRERGRNGRATIVTIAPVGGGRGGRGANRGALSRVRFGR